MCSSFHKMYIVTITSSTKSWLGTADRLFIATSIPSWSNPLYTSPNLPWPIKLLSLKPFVAKDNSSMWKRLASCEVNSTPAFFPTASDSDYLRIWENKYDICWLNKKWDMTLNRWIRRSCVGSCWNKPFTKNTEATNEKQNPHQCHGSCSTSYNCCKSPWHLATTSTSAAKVGIYILTHWSWNMKEGINPNINIVIKPKATKTLTKSSISAIK